MRKGEGFVFLGAKCAPRLVNHQDVGITQVSLFVTFVYVHCNTVMKDENENPRKRHTYVHHQRGLGRVLMGGKPTCY